MTEQVELAVVGAGPGGMEAAITAAEAGGRVTLIDGYPRPGGQYFKQVPASFHPSPGLQPAPHDREAQAMLGRLERAKVRLLADTVVWGAFPVVENGEWLLTLYGPQAPQRLQAQALILATGAYDRPIAFPGWTLPGVMTAGAVQTLLKNQRVLPGRRFLLSGTGPLQLAVAAQLIRAGAEVVGVLEGASLVGWRTVRHALALWGQGTRLAEGWDYWRTLRRAKAPFRFGWSAVEARGEEQVQEVVIARLNDAWCPIRQSRRTIAVDTLVIGYGFIPAVQLSGLLGCQHDFRPDRGGYVPRRDEEMQTSLPGIYAVGDGAGIGGAALAQVEGHIAGLAAARQVGRLDEGAAQAATARQRAALARERRFARMLGDLFTPGLGLYSLTTEETLICRCEEVPLAEIHQAIAAGARSANEVKGLTRCGMGNCQGRICEALLARAIATKLGPAPEYLQQVEAAGSFTPRPPLYPLPLTVLAEAAEVVGDEPA